MQSWYAVYTKPQKEDWAELNLNNMGLATLLPKYSKLDRRKKVHVRPLFPRYLFVHLDLDLPGWTSVQYARGVSRLVGFTPDGLPSAVPDDVIDAIRQHQGEDGLVELVKTKPAFEQGEEVKITDGVFQGLNAIFSSYLGDRDRVVVLLNLMERWVEITLSADQVSKSNQ